MLLSLKTSFFAEKAWKGHSQVLCDPRSVIAKLIAQPVRIPDMGQFHFWVFVLNVLSVPFLEGSLCHKHVLIWFISDLAAHVEIQGFRHCIFVWCTMKHVLVGGFGCCFISRNTFDLTSTRYSRLEHLWDNRRFTWQIRLCLSATGSLGEC